MTTSPGPLQATQAELFTPVNAEAKEERALEVHRRLCQVYDCPFPFFREADPLTELVGSVLSHRTKNADSGLALKQLREGFSNWHAVMDAPVGDIEAAIAPATWPEQKAPRIQQALRFVLAERGELSLEFLADLPVSEARDWLEQIPGVGPKTSAAVLLFSRLRLPALPVDAHHYRVAQRVGLLTKESANEAHRVLRQQLPDDWDAQTLYDNHEALMTHGQRCCTHSRPACGRCPLADICDYARS